MTRGRLRLRALLGTILLAAVCARCSGNSGTVPGGPTPVIQLPMPVPSAPQVFVGAGDIAMCDATGDEATARLLDGIPGTVFALGDNAYESGRTEDYRNCYNPSWGRHAGRTRPAPGNHDYESAGAAPYFQYFGGNAGPPGLGYYSFDLGSWHIISLNSNIPAQLTSAQGQWLKADLATYKNFTCTLAYWHHPLFTSGSNGDNAEMRDLWRLLYEAGADVVLTAHDHEYERFAPQDPDGRVDPARGIRQFVAGTGGGTLRPFASVHANSEARIALSYGVLKMTLQDGGYQWEFVPVSGPSDTGFAFCH